MLKSYKWYKHFKFNFFSFLGSLLNIVHAGSLLNQLTQRGIDAKASFSMSIIHVYGENQETNIDRVSLLSSFDAKNDKSQCPINRNNLSHVLI